MELSQLEHAKWVALGLENIRRSAEERAEAERKRLDLEQQRAKAELELRQAEERRLAILKQQEQARALQEAQAPKVTEQTTSSVAASAPAPPEQNKYCSAQASRQIEAYQSILDNLQKSVEGFARNPAQKEWRFGCKMRINRRVGQISASRKQVDAVATDLKHLLDEARGLGREAFLFSLDIMALKFVEQGEAVVHVHTRSAFPIAMVVLLVGLSHPDFLDVLYAHFLKKCPYVLPRFVARTEGQTDDGYRAAMGYVRNSDGSAYEERMTGILTLYASIVYTTATMRSAVQPHSSVTSSNVFSIEHAWAWLARLLNLPPRKMTPALILAFVGACGSELVRRYGVQFRKLVVLMKKSILPNLPAAAVANKTRLELFIADLEQSGGELPAPEGSTYD